MHQSWPILRYNYEARTHRIHTRAFDKVSEIADESGFYRRGKLPDSGLIGHMRGLVS